MGAQLWLRRIEQDPYAEGFVHFRYVDGTQGGFEWDCKLDLEGAGRVAQAWGRREALTTQAQGNSEEKRKPKI